MGIRRRIKRIFTTHKVLVKMTDNGDIKTKLVPSLKSLDLNQLNKKLAEHRKTDAFILNIILAIIAIMRSEEDHRDVLDDLVKKITLYLDVEF